MQVITKVQQIWEQGNKHMQHKLKYFGTQSQKVIKYIISKLRKYKGDFFESNKTISEACEVSVRTVQLAIKRAEQLSIFLVSERTELTINGKFRRTSNRIQLLSYHAVEVVKEVVEKVRNTVSKVVKKVVKPNKQRPSNDAPRQTQKRFTRVEIVPDWLGKEYVPPVHTEEKRLAFEADAAALRAKLREKYGKGKG